MSQLLLEFKSLSSLSRGLVVFVLCSLLISCGFHLRGAYPLPDAMSTTHIKADNPNSELVRQLKRSLKASDIQLVDKEAQATGILRISAEKQGKRVLSVDSKGRAREYELSYEVTFELQTAAGQVVFAEQNLKLVRDFLFDTEDVLGKGREEAVLIRDMQQDMVRLLLLRLSRQTLEPTASIPTCQGAHCQQGGSTQ